MTAKQIQTKACHLGCKQVLCMFIPSDMSFINAPVGSMRKLKRTSTKPLPASMCRTRLLDFCTRSWTRNKLADSFDLTSGFMLDPNFLSSGLTDDTHTPCWSSVIHKSIVAQGYIRDKLSKQTVHPRAPNSTVANIASAYCDVSADDKRQVPTDSRFMRESTLMAWIEIAAVN